MIEPGAIETLRTLLSIPALSGHEDKLIRYIRDTVTPWADRVHVDTVGNVIATINGQEASQPHVMCFAHMDQLGFMVRKIETNGYLRLERVGGVPEKALVGQRVRVETEDGREINGIIGVKSHHLTSPDEKYEVTRYKQLYVDVGVSSKDDAEALGISVGAPVTYIPSFLMLQDHISSPAIDNRAGCLVLLETLRRLSASRPVCTVSVVATVQEEFNLRGAMLAAAKLHPDFAVSIDVALAADTPDLEGESEIALDKGPVISLYSFHGRGEVNGTIPHPGLVKAINSYAKQHSIPVQHGVFMGMLTDASYVQLVGQGIPCVEVGIPTRYTHSPVETCSLSDLHCAIELLTGFLGSLDVSFRLTRGGESQKHY